MKKTLWLFGTLVFALLFNTCDKKVAKPSTTPAINACDTITYTKHIKRIIDAHCVYCHKAGSTYPPGIDFTQYPVLLARLQNGKLKANVIDRVDPMPKDTLSTALSAAQLSLIQCWINNGGKQ